MSTAIKWFLSAVILGFGSVISFFQINSYWADKHNFNGLFGWLGIGIVLGLGCVYSIHKTSKNSN